MNGFNFFDKIFYINLDKRTDRLEACKGELNKVGVIAERQPGIIYEGFENKYRNACVGNSLAHAQCLIKSKGFNNVLIFEDDIEWLLNPQEVLENLNQFLIELPEDWDMFYLGINMDMYEAYRISDHVAKITGGFSTHAYCVRSNLFDLLIDINSDKTIIHNDVAYANDVIPNHNVYVPIPLLAGQRKDFSDIQGGIMDSNPVFIQRFKDRMIK